MKNIFLLTAVCIILGLAGCASAKKSFEVGDYDRAIELAAQKLRRKPSDQKHMQIFAESYRIANDLDLEQIKTLRADVNQDHWEEIYNLYRRLTYRQNVAKQLPKLQGTIIPSEIFEYRDYDAEMADAKNNAAASNYQKGLELYKKGDRFSMRQANEYFRKVAQFNPNYDGLTEKINSSREAGFTHVLIFINTQTNIPIPESLNTELRNFDASSLNRDWIKFSLVEQFNFTYHYVIEVNVDQISVSPERVRETRFQEKKEVEDGWEYAKNPDGSVKRDTSGNKIKVPVYREVVANINQMEQYKECVLSGVVVLSDNQNYGEVQRERIQGRNFFSHKYAMATGDQRALTNATRNMLNIRPIGFPSNELMIQRAGTDLKTQMQNTIRTLRNRIQ